jgi:hypothetical protein
MIGLNSTDDLIEFCRSADLFCLLNLFARVVSDPQWIFVSKVEIINNFRWGFVLNGGFVLNDTPNNLYLSRELNQEPLVRC